MNKTEFLTSVGEKLCGLPEEDIQKSLDFYSEMIDEMIEDGMSEEDAVLKLGLPCDVAEQILMDTSLPKLVKASRKPARDMKSAEILLLILGFPLWFPLLIAFFSVLFAFAVTVWSLVVSLYAVVLSFTAAGTAFLVSSVFLAFTNGFATGLFSLGSGLICASLAVFLFILSAKAAKGALRLMRGIGRRIKSWLIGKRSA